MLILWFFTEKDKTLSLLAENTLLHSNENNISKLTLCIPCQQQHPSPNSDRKKTKNHHLTVSIYNK